MVAASVLHLKCGTCAKEVEVSRRVKDDRGWETNKDIMACKHVKVTLDIYTFKIWYGFDDKITWKIKCWCKRCGCIMTEGNGVSSAKGYEVRIESGALSCSLGHQLDWEAEFLKTKEKVNTQLCDPVAKILPIGASVKVEL